MTTYKGNNATLSLKGQGLLSNLFGHLSFALDAICAIVAFWLVDQCTFASAERQARQAAEKARNEARPKEEQSGYFGKWWNKGDQNPKPQKSLVSLSRPTVQHSSSESGLALPLDITSPQGSSTRSLTLEASPSHKLHSPPISPAPWELHHFQKKILKRQMERSLQLALVLRRIVLASLATLLLFAGAFLCGLNLKAGLGAMSGWY